MAESAIAKHLVSSSALPPNLKEGYEPPYPTYTSRFSSKTTQIVIFILGSQHSSESRTIRNSTEPGGIPPRIVEPWPSQISANNEMATALRRMVDFVTTPPGECKPTFYDLASRTDNNGIYEQCLIAYWSTKTAYDDWCVTSGFGRWWSNLDPATVRHGWFLELLLPPIERHENAFTSAEVPEGTGHLQEGVSGAIREHGYWGSMRDRLPISQISHLNGDKITHGVGTVFDSRTRRIRVPGKSNLAVIRSGQDWSCTPPEERNLYVTRMHPVLTEGMNFLRDEGLQVGCYSCRFMDVLEKETGQPEVQKTFGLAYFNELASLEKWSEHHPTHKRIFQSFTRIAKKLQDNLSLRFFHEVLVLEPEQQFFEYVNCHPRSGMLSSL